MTSTCISVQGGGVISPFMLLRWDQWRCKVFINSHLKPFKHFSFIRQPKFSLEVNSGCSARGFSVQSYRKQANPGTVRWWKDVPSKDASAKGSWEMSLWTSPLLSRLPKGARRKTLPFHVTCKFRNWQLVWELKGFGTDEGSDYMVFCIFRTVTLCTHNLQCILHCSQLITQKREVPEGWKQRGKERGEQCK